MEESRWESADGEEVGLYYNIQISDLIRTRRIEYGNVGHTG